MICTIKIIIKIMVKIMIMTKMMRVIFKIVLIMLIGIKYLLRIKFKPVAKVKILIKVCSMCNKLIYSNQRAKMALILVIKIRMISKLRNSCHLNNSKIINNNN